MPSSTTSRRRHVPAASARRSPLLVFAAGVLLGGLVVGLLGGAASRPDTPEPNSMEEIAAALADEYDAEQRRLAEALTDETRHVHADLMTLLGDLDAVLPVHDPATGRPADAEAVATWRARTQDAVDHLAPFGHGSPAFNGTHGSLLGAVRQLDAAVVTYAEAVATDGPAADRLVALAAEQRDNAVELWAVAAEQLDELNIDAGLGHVHLFLPADGDPVSVPLEFHDH
ncbi:hypothetical protein [Egicoccus sp. AB-alg2]|uniref:hypothetical protein n=1 Tax=Egicoccus sp. AB-alg2 TaxID=3242693 RepID=UPI00359F09C4